MVRVGDIIRDPALLRVGMRIEAQSPLRGAFRCVLTKWERGDDGHFYMAARREDGFAYDTIMPESIVMAGVEILALPDGDAVQPGHEICPGCGKEIDPITCGCGDSVLYHERAMEGGHPFIPMGCDCYRAKDETPAPPTTPRCAPDCTPAAPCRTAPCPQLAEDVIRTSMDIRLRVRRRVEPTVFEPSRSGLGALACGMNHVKPPR